PVPDQGLYSFANEHDACGVGVVADLEKEASHRTVELGITVLKRLMHRGAAGSDPETGDGAGILSAIPDAFFHKLYPELPPAGRYGVAVIFGGEGVESEIEEHVTQEGLSIFAWRDVPCDPSAVGRTARETMPRIRQLIVVGGSLEGSALERKLFVARRVLEKNFSETLYICSMSCRSIVYKGLMLATQIEKFYSDLADPDFKSRVILVHQRYSTNTFPTWSLAHPFRYLAHNGEINTLRGNLNSLSAREPHLESALLGKDLAKVLPLIRPGQSDSASLDNMFELLVASGRTLEHAMLMLIPQAWGKRYYMGRDVRGFFEYHSALMEPWDGPAAVAASDGVNALVILDRNGLRPARYTLCDDGLFVLASETGVVDLETEHVVSKGRLKPGEMIYLDLVNHRLEFDAEIKSRVARRQPYRRWADEHKLQVNGLFSEIAASQVAGNLASRQKLFGYSREDLSMILTPMAATGKEPIGSMGNDAALPVLSGQNPSFFHYFQQLFAQVTNPPIDPIREELVMSLTTYIGNQGNILAEGPEYAKLIKLPRPVLTDDETQRLETIGDNCFRCRKLVLGFPGEAGGEGLREALQKIASDAVKAVGAGYRIIVLSDRDLAPELTPMPSLLAVSAVNRALARAGRRAETGLIVQTAEAREVMHFALLIGYGATAVNPYLALETVSSLAHDGQVRQDAVAAAGNYIAAVDKGLLKIMSKMGISTLRSYRSGQNFEAVGLGRELIDEFLPGTISRIGGITLDDVAAEAVARRKAALSSAQSTLLPESGEYKFRKEGENHLWTPQSLAAFRQAVWNNDYAKFQEYSRLIDDQANHLCTLRGLWELKPLPTGPIPIEEVEEVESILHHFVSGAMSLGALSPEAHEAIAVAMNSIGCMSNCGEGGEDEERRQAGAHGENRRSAIKQVASGRFGVTIDYLRDARDIQIKMAQGAKPGEGGQLPGHKVNEFVARVRHAMPHVTLISPPPHHDIYSIEDLAELIFDLRNANAKARISVKLVSEVGVGTIASGVAKAHADVVLISGHDGGTGASPLTSIKHAGLPWELGLAETQQTLVLNQLRSRVKIQLDGQLKTGRDIVIGALLGAEEFGFATTILVCLGCVMMRQCHSNSCPVGVATQDPELRKNFRGKPEYIVNFLRFLAMEAREELARLGLHSLAEACGRSDLIGMNRAIDFYKAQKLDFTQVFARAEGGKVSFDPGDAYAGAQLYDQRELFAEVLPDLGKRPIEIARTIRNVDRAAGTALSGEIAERFGLAGLPEKTPVTIDFTGIAGQSFGAFLARHVTLRLEGEANDFVGKGLSGGRIVIRPPRGAKFAPESNVIAGNVIGYGGTSGEIYLNGLAGERFAIRNSGVTLVAEGVGDHGCEYMTGGRVVILGRTGVNFAAGMTGGFAYVYDETGHFDLSCNLDSVDLESVPAGSDGEAELLAILRRHVEYTASPKARRILDDWSANRPKFVRIFPVEYRQALAKMQAK
ncbi:MAG: glutamate synthase large subunit, partial [Victivallaceae bacterium]|nr:glutamate synthase large subunit [Victivallaceae bacterium]